MIIKSPAAEVNGNFALGLLPGMTVIGGKYTEQVRGGLEHGAAPGKTR